MKLLVTGREGQLARSLAERASGRPGIELVRVGRPAVDLEVPGSLAAAIRAEAPDLVINAAAYTAVDQAEDEPGRAFRVNAEAAGEAAAAARAAGAPIVQISTDYVFDGRSAEHYREDSETNPLSVYGASKLAGEEQVRANTPDHLILRTAWVYSPFGRNFVKTMLRLASERDEIAVVSDQTGSPTSAHDLADGLLAIADAWGNGERTGAGETFHLAGCGRCSWAEFAEAIFAECDRIGHPAARVRRIGGASYAAKALRPANSVLDSSVFEAEFGYRMPEWRRSLPAVVERLAAEGRQ